MESFELLPGKIKRIESSINTKKNSVIRVVEGIIIDYIYDGEAKESMKHKLDCITLSGDLSVIYINENSCISDIEVDDNTRECLNNIRKSILNKRQATKTIAEERIKIEELTNRLLAGVNALNREDFIKKLTSKLDKLGDYFKYSLSKYNNNYVLDIKLNSLDISFVVKKHFISGIKIRGFVNTNKVSCEIDEIKDRGIFANKKEFVNIESKKIFLDKYGVTDIFNSRYYDFLERSSLILKDDSYCCSNYTDVVKYKISHIISKEDNKIFLSDENIDMILELIKNLY